MSSATSRYPLAFDQNGNPLEIPEGAVAWRVRRGGGRRGRPRNVFDPETGRQLEIPLGANLDELINAGCEADRYLLYPIDAEGRIVPGLIAVTEVPRTDEDQPEQGASGVADESYVGQLLATIKAQADALCRAIDSTSSGYGNVRPPVPPPITFDQPLALPKDEGFKAEHLANIMGMAKTVFDALKGAGVGTPEPSGGGS